MRNVASILIAALAVGCVQCHAAEPAADPPKSKQDRPAKPRGLEGIYCTPVEISGFSGTALELKDGKFEYWFYSDVGTGDEPEYPVTGKYSQKDGQLTLNHEQVSQRDWFPAVIKGVRVLLRPDAWKIWREQKKIYDYGVLIQVDETVDDDGDVERPSVKQLYGAGKKDREWKDPFVHGPQ